MPTAVIVRLRRRARQRSALLGLRFGFGHALQVLAGALGHVLPLAGVVVRLGLSCAGMRVGQIGTVVLSGLGDAVALLLVLALGSDLSGDTERQYRGQGRGDEQTLVHGTCSLLKFVVAPRATPRAVCRPATSLL